MKIKIRTKFLLATLILLIATLGATDFLWYRLVRPIITDRLASAQRQLADHAADTIDQYLLAKERVMIVHSQSAAFLTQNRDLQKVELYTLFSEDRDIDNISVLDAKGHEVLKFDRTREIPPSELTDQHNDPGYIATTFRFGREYIGPVEFDGTRPSLKMAVPIIVPTSSQRLTDLTTSTKLSRYDGEILGVLTARIHLDDMYHGVTNLSNKETGTVYIVDNGGRILAHQSGSVKPLTDVSYLDPVKTYMSTSTVGESSTEAKSLIQYQDRHGDSYLGTYTPARKTSWAVIVQQPASTALAQFNQITQFALLILIFGLVLALPVAYVLSSRLTSSIGQLVQGAQIIGSGNFDYQMQIRTHDEVADLGRAFFQMASQLKESIKAINNERSLITAERNKLSTIIASIQDAVIAVDTHYNITLVNRTAEIILGVTNDAAYGKPISSFVRFYQEDTEILPSTYAPQSGDITEGTIYSGENVKAHNSSGHTTYVNILTGRIKSDQPTSIGSIVTLHDNTKDRQLEEMKLDFVSMAAHELRTPLTAISGYLSVFMQENTASFTPEQNSFLNRIMISTQRLFALVENLLNVSKIERNGLTINPRPIDWPSHVKQLIGDFETYAREQSVSLTYIEPTENIPVINIDSIRIDEVLSNLISNAINYTRAGGHVKVTIEYRDHHVITNVIDDGPGIPETALPHLFTKFFRVSGKLEQGSKGTGLGLYISKAIIDMHHGQIWVNSVFGRGSTFSFSLPIDTAEK